MKFFSLLYRFASLLIVLTLVSIYFYISGYWDDKISLDFIPDASVCVSDTCLNVYIADELDEQIQGLMHVEDLDENLGMLFLYNDEQIRSLWMKNTLIPLDMIFLNAEREIVTIHENSQACVEEPCEQFRSSMPSQYIIETNAGFVETNNLKVGQKFELQY